MRTRGQERSAYALEQVCRIPQGKKKEDFTSFSAGVPAMILQNGLGQTVAFLCAKAKGDVEDKHYRMVEIIKMWIAQSRGESIADHKDFIRLLSERDQGYYLSVQQEVLRLLEWVKRYANAGM
jgi:CRISPR-associated protein Cmr5